ncbi:MAG: helix-turn-helix transcriptional regulator [Sphingomonas sp.]|nr:helix-turn-helix transcriptional regulator [Sphingomonas sp.]
MATSPNVFPLGQETLPRSLFGRPSSRTYRAAVAQIVREVKARHGINDERFAELVGCDKDTIRNAENEETNLNAVTLFSIAYAFGEEAIEPVRALYLCAPVEEPTIADRCRRIRGELAAIEKEAEE